MKPLLRFVELDRTPIFQQLQWEEALLRVDTRNWCLINRGSPPAIVMGISGQMEQLISLDLLKKSPLPVIRRFSGGGTVVIDENTLFVTLICQSNALPIHPFPRPLMQWAADLYRPFFPDKPFDLQENDFVLGEKKWGGNAQSIVKGRWLHHSSLLWDYHSERMDYLLLPEKMPVYRKKRDHQDFLCRLKDHWVHSTSFEEEMLKALRNHFSIEIGEVVELRNIASQPHRKATTLIN